MGSAPGAVGVADFVAGVDGLAPEGTAGPGPAVVGVGLGACSGLWVPTPDWGGPFAGCGDCDEPAARGGADGCWGAARTDSRPRGVVSGLLDIATDEGGRCKSACCVCSCG